MKKHLIITAGLGNGHNSAAKGLKKQYNEKGEDVEIIDITEITIMGKIMKFFFFNLSEKNLQKLFDNTNYSQPKKIDLFFYKTFFKKISNLISKKNPKSLIFTFPCFPLCVPKNYKGNIIIQVTDYISPHKSWIWGEFTKINVLDNESKKYLSPYIDENKIEIKEFPLCHIQHSLSSKKNSSHLELGV